MGFKVGNDIFAKNSWYFRNALVRANYKNVRKGIQQEPEYLEKFFRKLLMGEHNELRNPCGTRLAWLCGLGFEVR